jgi:tetratricopeptide (TPR) repeat protein
MHESAGRRIGAKSVCVGCSAKRPLLMIFVALFGFRLLSSWGYQQESVQQQRKEIESQVQRLLANNTYAKKYARFNSDAVKEFWLGSLLCGYNDLDSANSLQDPAAEKQAFEDGIMHLERAISLDPHFSDAYLALGRALRSKSFLFVDDRYGKEADELRKEEVQVYRKAVEVDPTNVEAHFAYGTSLKDPKERLKELQTVLGLEPNHREVHQELGYAYESLGDQEKAILEYKKQIEICPGCDDTYPQLINLLAKKGREAELMEICKKYVVNNPGGLMLLINGPTSWNLPGGLVQLEKERGLTNVSDLIETMAASALFETSVNTEAISAFRVLLKREPNRREIVIKHLEKYESKHQNGSKPQYKGTKSVDPVNAFLAELKGSKE